MQQAYFSYPDGGAYADEGRTAAISFGRTFANYDEEQLRQTLRWLAEQENQIFLFTCRETENEASDGRGYPFCKYTIINMKCRH